MSVIILRDSGGGERWSVVVRRGAVRCGRRCGPDPSGAGGCLGQLPRDVAAVGENFTSTGTPPLPTTWGRRERGGRRDIFKQYLLSSRRISFCIEYYQKHLKMNDIINCNMRKDTRLQFIPFINHNFFNVRLTSMRNYRF